MGTEGAKAYSKGGRINTDDNLYLEFSAPQSIGISRLQQSNVSNLAKYRESILPYLISPTDDVGKARQKRIWQKNLEAARLDDRAHVLTLAGQYDDPEYEKLKAELDARYPAYAPWRFLMNEISDETGGTPTLLNQIDLALLSNTGETATVRFSAVIMRKDRTIVSVFFVDSNSHVIFGKLRVRGANRDAYVASAVDDILKSVQALYNEELNMNAASGKTYPSAASLLPKIKNLVEMKVDRGTR
jgi:spermidine synthase